MIFLTIYLIGVVLAWLIIAVFNDEFSNDICSLLSILSWVIVILILTRFLFTFMFVFFKPSLKPIKNLYKRIFKQ